VIIGRDGSRFKYNKLRFGITVAIKAYAVNAQNRRRRELPEKAVFPAR
jgi:hypothetical protein